MKCEYCDCQGIALFEIKNFVVRYQTWEAYNCCCEECAKKRAMSDLNLREDEIIDIE